MVTYNRLEYTKVAVDAMLALDYPDLTIVVWDNASCDGTVAWLQERFRGDTRVQLIASPVNRGIVHPMNAVWFGQFASGGREPPVCAGMGTGYAPNGSAPFELMAKIDNDTWVPPDLLLRLADCHRRSDRFGVLSGFHFRAEGEALVDDSRVSEIDAVRVLAQPYVGGCAVMVRRSILDRLGPIPCRGEAQQGPLMDSGWTFYQQRLTDEGLINGYPWPPIHVDHMEDTRSPRCIRTPEYEQYKRDLRGMSPEQFTQELCVWRPSWMQSAGADAGSLNRSLTEVGVADNGNGRQAPSPPASTIRSTAPVAVGSVTDQGHRRSDHGQQMTRHGNGPVRAEGINAVSGGQPRVGRMHFVQDFVRDFEQFDFRGAPFAFARFADGERAICMGQAINGADGWRYPGGASPVRDALLAALHYVNPDYYIGISDGCCDPEAKAWYLREVQLPLSQVTFSNIFVNGNYVRFKQLDLSDVAVVASEGGDFWVPVDMLNTSFDIDKLVERLLRVNRPILISAGPSSCVIIHRYWMRASANQRQVIVDVGSAIDERTKGRATRQYHVPGTRNAELVCSW
jgi:hypothetical protein